MPKFWISRAVKIEYVMLPVDRLAKLAMYVDRFWFRTTIERYKMTHSCWKAIRIFFKPKTCFMMRGVQRIDKSIEMQSKVPAASDVVERSSLVSPLNLSIIPTVMRKLDDVQYIDASVQSCSDIDVFS